MSWPSPISPAEMWEVRSSGKSQGKHRSSLEREGPQGGEAAPCWPLPCLSPSQAAVPDAESPARAPSSARGAPRLPAGLPVRLVQLPLPCTPLNDFISSQRSSPSSCSAHISPSYSGARTKGQGLPPTPATEESVPAL